jgi:hypothetical protein
LSSEISLLDTTGGVAYTVLRLYTANRRGQPVAEDAWIGLAEAISQLRSELEAARLDATERDLRFTLGPIEMEFTLDIRNTGSGDAGVRWGVISIGTKGERSTSTGHRLKLTLRPTDSVSGKDIEVTTVLSEIPPA